MKCNKLGDEEVIILNYPKNQGLDTCFVDEEEDDHLFIAMCISSLIGFNKFFY